MRAGANEIKEGQEGKKSNATLPGEMAGQTKKPSSTDGPRHKKKRREGREADREYIGPTPPKALKEAKDNTNSGKERDQKKRTKP
jgi:hypothetical protein